jgi:hypothetical protein
VSNGGSVTALIQISKGGDFLTLVVSLVQRLITI